MTYEEVLAKIKTYQYPIQIACYYKTGYFVNEENIDKLIEYEMIDYYKNKSRLSITQKNIFVDSYMESDSIFYDKIKSHIEKFLNKEYLKMQFISISDENNLEDIIKGVMGDNNFHSWAF